MCRRASQGGPIRPLPREGTEGTMYTSDQGNSGRTTSLVTGTEGSGVRPSVPQSERNSAQQRCCRALGRQVRPRGAESLYVSPCQTYHSSCLATHLRHETAGGRGRLLGDRSLARTRILRGNPDLPACRSLHQGTRTRPNRTDSWATVPTFHHRHLTRLSGGPLIMPCSSARSPPTQRGPQLYAA